VDTDKRDEGEDDVEERMTAGDYDGGGSTWLFLLVVPGR
jgi:hypothetical protein